MKTIQGIIFILIAALVVGGSTSRLSAEEQPSTAQLDARLTQTVTVADLVTYAYRENPSILSAKEAWNATVERYGLATALPDPQLNASYFPEPIETRLGPQDWNLEPFADDSFSGKTLQGRRSRTGRFPDRPP